MEYIKVFNRHSDYEEYIASPSVLKPNVSFCIAEKEDHYLPKPHDYSKDYFTIESLENNNTIYFRASNTSVTKTISASTDNGETWEEYTTSTGDSGVTIATINNGKSIIFKGENNTYATGMYQNSFLSTNNFVVKGNVMSLVSGDSFENVKTLTGNYVFRNLFKSCQTLISSENLVLPATTLSESCYSSMFIGCGMMEKSPKELLAPELVNGCYSSMFSGCTSLVTTPVISATSIPGSQSCQNMFRDCTSLTTAPELPITDLGSYGQYGGCYEGMFYGCTSLTKAPTLPATTVPERAYREMFYGCTSLTTPPVISATTIGDSGCYQMFLGCTSLVKAPDILATSVGVSGCTFMFMRCTSLERADVILTTTVGASAFDSMFYLCSGLTTVPSTLLPTTMTQRCYQSMFAGCTSLTTAPELPATSLGSAYYCYRDMFQGCTNLNYIKAMFTDNPSPNYTFTENWVNGVAASGTFVKNSAAQWTMTGVHGVPTGWTVQTVTP